LLAQHVSKRLISFAVDMAGLCARRFRNCEQPICNAEWRKASRIRRFLCENRCFLCKIHLFSLKKHRRIGVIRGNSRTDRLSKQHGMPVSAGRRQARSEYVDPQQSTHVSLVDDIIDRELGEDLEECVERLAQGRVQTAAIDQRAISSIVFKTLRHGEIFLGHPHYVEEGNILGRFAELDAAISATHGFNETILNQGLKDLEQEKFGDRIGLGNFTDSAEVAFIGGTVHENPDGIIRLSCQSHGNISFDPAQPGMFNLRCSLELFLIK